jgi:hypothetical protein
MRNKILFLKKKSAFFESIYKDELFSKITLENMELVLEMVDELIKEINNAKSDNRLKQVIYILNNSSRQFNKDLIGTGLKRMCVILFWEFYKKDDINSFIILNELLLSLNNYVRLNDIKVFYCMTMVKKIGHIVKLPK